MKITRTPKFIEKLAAVLLLTVGFLMPSIGVAAMKCEEVLANRVCLDSAARSVSTSDGYTTAVSAPLLSGFDRPCWVWDRKFKCIESNPTYTCESGTQFDTVKNECNLTEAVTNATTNVNGVTYITSASYDYRCKWGEWTTDETLPTGKECVMLDQTVTDTNTVASAPAGSVPTGSSSNLSGSTVVDQERADSYVCYSAPVTTCSDTCYDTVVDPATGTMKQVPVECTAPVTNCVTTSNQCDNTLANAADGALTGDLTTGPDGRCISSKEQLLCQSGAVPRCLEKDNCTLTATTPTNIQSNGIPMSQEQTYICSNEVTSCLQYANVSSCVHAGAWGWDKSGSSSQVGSGLAEYNQAMSRLEGIQKGMAENDPYIFSGMDMRCHYNIGNFLNTVVIAVVVIAASVSGAGLIIAASALNDAATSQAFGADCCKDYVVEGSDKWFSFGSCSGAEVKLAVARLKGLTYPLGEYCSKKSGFPFEQCVEKSRTYCVFDDMLAYSVNEQGRQQLDAIAAADGLTTKVTPEQPIALFSPAVTNPIKYSGYLNTGKWLKQATHNGSQVWTWQYPAYCASTTAQAEAYAMQQAEMEKAADTTGIKDPKHMTPAEAKALLESIGSVAPFQECPSTPGLMTYLTCSLKDDNCDVTRLPPTPSGTGTDITGYAVSNEDVNWRTQQLRSFYKLGDYGVTAAMESDSTYAAVGGSVNEFITAVGSCRTTGDCLYRFAITDKKAVGSVGARKRVSQTVGFAMYTATPSQNTPAVDYVDPTGQLIPGRYETDPNRGLGNAVTIGGQRFIFHPHLLRTAPPATINPNILVEYANTVGELGAGQNDFKPLLVPTNLPVGTSEFYPYGDAGVVGKSFYLNGGCDPSSRWCTYTISADLAVPRHPWGSAENPRCWGFSLDQLSSLDFDKMDLSRWINSLDLGQGTGGMSAEAASQMTQQVTNSANTLYKTFSDGSSTTSPAAGAAELVFNTDTLPKLSSAYFESYVLEVGVPSNWPKWFTDSANINPVTNVEVNWGDGTPSETMKKHADGYAYVASHDYGGKLAGTYTVRVTLDTLGNGQQTLTKKVRITPNGGTKPTTEELDFTMTGANGKSAEYTPSDSLNQTNVSPGNIQQVSPGTVEQFNQQGGSVNKSN